MKFIKGQSGNPSGRPKAIKGLIEKYGHDAEKIRPLLMDLAVNGKDESVRLGAMKEINDRALGRPAVQVGVAGSVTHEHFVVRAPAIEPNAAAWEAKFGGKMIEHEPARPEKASDPIEPAAQPIENKRELEAKSEPERAAAPTPAGPKPWPIPGEFRRPAGETLGSFDEWVKAGKPVRREP